MLLRGRHFGSAQVFANLAFVCIALVGVSMTMTGCKQSGMAVIIFFEMSNVQRVGLSYMGVGVFLHELSVLRKHPRKLLCEPLDEA